MKISKTGKYLIALVVVAIVIMIVAVPMLNKTEILGYGITTLRGWKDTAGNYRTGLAGNPFYVGETIKAINFSCHYISDPMQGHPCLASHCTLTLYKGDDESGTQLWTSSKSTGPVDEGDTLYYEFIHNVVLADSTWLVGVYAAAYWTFDYDYGSEIDYLRLLKHCSVQNPEPVLSIQSYTLNKQSVHEGDSVTASFTIKNTGTVASSATIVLYPDVNDHNEYYDNEYQIEQNVIIAANGGTISRAWTFTAHGTDVQYNDPDFIYVGLDASDPGTYTHPVSEILLPFLTSNDYILTINTNPVECLVVQGVDTVTSYNGVATFIRVPGTYDVSVSKYGYTTGTINDIVIANANVDCSITLVPDGSPQLNFDSPITGARQGATIQFKITSEGKPESGVSVTGSWTGVGNSDFTDVKGVAELTLPTVTNETVYTVTATKTNHQLATISVTVTIGGGIDLLIISIIVAVIALSIFLVLAYFGFSLFRYIFLIVGIVLAVVLFYIIYYLNIIGL